MLMSIKIEIHVFWLIPVASHLHTVLTDYMGGVFWLCAAEEYPKIQHMSKGVFAPYNMVTYVVLDC